MRSSNGGRVAFVAASEGVRLVTGVRLDGRTGSGAIMGAGTGLGEDLGRAETGTSTIGSARRPAESVAGTTNEPSFCGTGGRGEMVPLLFVGRLLGHQTQARAPMARNSNTRSMIPPAFLAGGTILPEYRSRIIGFFGETAPF